MAQSGIGDSDWAYAREHFMMYFHCVCPFLSLFLSVAFSGRSSDKMSNTREQKSENKQRAKSYTIWER